MRRITSIILVAAFVLGGAVSAMAASNVDIKVKGQWDFAFGWFQNKKFADSQRHSKKYGYRQDDNGIAAQRIRTQVNFIMSENLQAVLQFEIGDIHWGHNQDGKTSGRGSGGRLGADGVNIETKHAYLDWMVPSTDLHIRMGLQGLALPSVAIGNPVFDDDVAAVVASYKFNDMVAVTAFWARPYNQYLNDSNDGNYNRSVSDEVDMFGLIVPITLDGVNITPWGVYARVGSDSGLYDGLYDDDMGAYLSNDAASAWWGGLSLDVDLWDPLTFGIDAMYGRLGKNTVGADASPGNPITGYNDYATGGVEVKTSGWFLAATLDYKLDWGTPGLFAWWSSGDDYDDIKEGKFGRIPVFPTSSGLNRTSFSWDGAFGIADGEALSLKGIGTWGVGIQIADMSFIEDLSHTIRFVYHQGTNDNKIIKNGGHDLVHWAGVETMYLTDKDHAFEVNFDHKYQIYENLAAVLELGWIHLNLDKNTWRDASLDGRNGHKTDDAWKAQLSFQYKF